MLRAAAVDERVMNMPVVSTQKMYVDIILVYTLLHISGSWRFKLLPDMYLIAVFGIVLIAWYLYGDRKISDRFLLYVTIYSSLLLALSLYTKGSLSLPTVIGLTLKMLLAYLIIQTVKYRFVYTYVSVMVFLAVISLLGYATDMLRLFDGIITKLPKVGTWGYEGYLYTFRQVNHMTRNNSIFFEPGAYQGFLNSAIFILFFLKTGLSKKRTWAYLGVLISALLTTFSTTGMIIFAMMLIVFFFKSEMLSFQEKAKFLIGTVIIGIIMAPQIYSTVVVKVNEYIEADEYADGSSARDRSAQAQTDLKIFKDSVFGLGNRDYNKAFGYFGRIELEEENTSSNGVTKTLAVYGLPFSLFIFGSYFWAFRALLGESFLAGLAFVILLMFLTGESFYISAPITLAVIAGAFVSKSTSRLQQRLTPGG